MSKIYIGIDNGVTGSIGVVNDQGAFLLFTSTPVVQGVSYTKSKMRHRTRINYSQLHTLFIQILRFNCTATIKAFIERPMINNFRFFASISASASLEATLIALEECEIGYEFVDSKGWQKMLLPTGCKGDDLKNASRDIGVRLFPQAQGIHVDCDGLLIAEWSRRLNL
jgi:hypothetical protein